MKIFLIRKRSGVEACAEYNVETKTVTVKKGSKVSEKIAYSEKFRGAYSVEKYREGAVENGVVIKDIVFKSASTAANFVTGASTNGLVAWKNEEGESLKSIITKEDTNE